MVTFRPGTPEVQNLRAVVMNLEDSGGSPAKFRTVKFTCIKHSLVGACQGSSALRKNVNKPVDPSDCAAIAVADQHRI